MKTDDNIAIFGEILAIDQRLRGQLAKALPKGMELSHFSVLNHLATVQGERQPAQIAKALHVSRAAISNTLSKLEARGDVHIRQGWDDAREKFVSISDAGRLNRDLALKAAQPLFEDAIKLSDEEKRKLLNLLRDLRITLDG